MLKFGIIEIIVFAISVVVLYFVVKFIIKLFKKV